VVEVSIQAFPARCGVAFGSMSELRTTPLGKLAIFAPGKIIAYAIRCRPWQALYLFRTTATEDSATHLKGVSEPVNLLYVANARRTVDKTLTALRGLRGRIGDSGIDALPDLYWLRLVDHIERRGRQILSHSRSPVACLSPSANSIPARNS
jgi:hypothetical protein